MFFSLERFILTSDLAIALLGLVCSWEKGSPQIRTLPLGQSEEPTTQSCVHLQICCLEENGCIFVVTAELH